MHKIDVAAAWGKQLQAALFGLSAEVNPAEIEAVRNALSALAWREGCPRAHRARSDEELTYRRQLVVAAPDRSYSALLITWPPGYVTPVHDHSRLWGIELVLDGALEVREFMASEDAPIELQFTRSVMLGAGDATTFLDPSYAHSCRNLSDSKPALSLHVYGGMLEDFHSFHQEADGQFGIVRRRAEHC
jgi:predicted metal-dependent enzyme (double-stranded beta helix superfamily)